MSNLFFLLFMKEFKPVDINNFYNESIPEVKINRRKKGLKIEEFEPKAIVVDEVIKEETKKEFDVPKLENVNQVEEFISDNLNESYNIETLISFLLIIAEKLTNFKFFHYQKVLMERIFRAVLNNEGVILTGLLPRQSGKSQSVACAVATLCVTLPTLSKIYPKELGDYSKGFWVGIYAPTDEQADTIYQKIKNIGHSQEAEEVYNDPDFKTRFKKTGCHWTNGSYVYRQSSDKRTKLESKSWHFVVFEEAQDLEEEVILRKILPMLAWTNGSSIMIGTVVDYKCYFKEQIDNNIRESVILPEKRKLHIEYDYNEVIKYNEKYKKHVEQQIKRFGINSKYFRMSYALIWDSLNKNPITKKDLIEKTMYKKLGLVKYSDMPVVVGIDLAKVNNSTVVTICGIYNTKMQFEDGYSEKATVCQILNWLELTELDYITQRSIMYDFIKRYSNVLRIVVDGTGAGTVIVEQMMREWNDIGCIWEDFKFNNKTKGELYDIFSEYYNKNLLLVPSDEFTKNTKEWKNFIYQCTSAVKVEKGGYHFLEKHSYHSRDDYLDSWFLAIYGYHLEITTRMPVISEKVDITKYVKNNMSLNYMRRMVYNGQYAKKDIKKSRLETLMEL